MPSYYKDLQLTAPSSVTEVKKAYRKLAKLYHPDKNLSDNDSVQNFIKVKKAYEFLTNEPLKNKYDNELIRYKGKAKAQHDPILVKQYFRKVRKRSKNFIYAQKITVKENQCEKCEGYGQLINRFTAPSICPVCFGTGRKSR